VINEIKEMSNALAPIVEHQRQLKAENDRLKDQLAEALELLELALSSFRCTQSPGSYSDEHWSNRAIKALAGGEG